MKFNKKLFASLGLAAVLSSCSEPVETAKTSSGMKTLPSDFISQVGPNGDRVFFGFNKSDVTAEGQEVLSRQATYLASRPAEKITEEGHCDSRGSDAYNMGLGERRANAAKNYLVALGVHPSRIEVVSYGKSRPAVLGNDENAHSLNRRSVTVVGQ